MGLVFDREPVAGWSDADINTFSDAEEGVLWKDSDSFDAWSVNINSDADCRNAIWNCLYSYLVWSGNGNAEDCHEAEDME